MQDELTHHIGNADFPYVRLQHTCGDSAEIYLHGAHLTSWCCGTQEQLFLSQQSLFAQGKAIRGGVPIIFPQFGAFGPGAKHGFARNLAWSLDQVNSSGNRAEFTLEADQATRALWPYDFAARYIVTLMPATLLMQLQITNTGTNPFEFTSALHTYFASPNYAKGVLSGLQDLHYWDNGTPWELRQLQTSNDLIIADALDRVYFNCTQPLTWQDQTRSLQICASGFTDTVVWNPGCSGAQALADMADDEYHNMVCVEAANVAQPIKLACGETWLGSQQIQKL
jgi:glucose-6-phosphate 1-epimerase